MGIFNWFNKDKNKINDNEDIVLNENIVEKQKDEQTYSNDINERKTTSEELPVEEIKFENTNEDCLLENDTSEIIPIHVQEQEESSLSKKTKKEKVGIFKKIANALKKTKESISNKIDSIFHKELDDEFFENLEEILIMSDLGYETSEEIIDGLRTKCKKEKLKTCDEAKNALRQVIEEMMTSGDERGVDDSYPKVVIIVGVNGVGKTTSIGKLANYYNSLGKKVVVVAGDTFRAGASAQLNVWANRADVKIVKQNEGADSASVVYDGISFAKAKGFDVVLVDTAGRLHNKVNLMEELSKVNRVATKNWEEAHFERYIVIDATTGQNAVNQVREFDSVIDLDGIILTKLDGTAKGGIVVSICHEFEIPVKFVGVGENIDDLVPFNVNEFVEGIL